jgi:lipopolysaccharide/colanic/teichoic acid biosynthesis glycosyltransferase
MLKRLFDIIFSLIGLILLSPLFLIIAILIKLEDNGSIFYRGMRAGKNGKPFGVLKFRTMVMNADRIGGPSTADDDARITKIGKFMRKYKLDEIPQLINVLKGQMSIVGPRPEVLSEVETYNEEERRVLLVKPGITDWASLKFHNEGEILKNSPDSHEAYRRLIKPEKIKLALKYVDEQSFFVDIKIIFQTFVALIKSRF